MKMAEIEREVETTEIIELDRHVLSGLRSKCKSNLDVWASVEVCRAYADPVKCPSMEDAIGRYSDDKDFAEYVLGQVFMLREAGTRKVKKNRETDWDAKMRSAIVDTILRAMKPDFDFHGTGKVRQAPGLKDIVTKDGFDPVMEVWDETQRAIDGSTINDLEVSILVVYPRRGKWSGMGSDHGKWTKYRNEARHIRLVNKFVSDWSRELAGTK